MNKLDSHKKERRGRKKSKSSKLRDLSLELRIENYLSIDLFLNDLYSKGVAEEIFSSWAELANILKISSVNSVYLIATKKRKITPQMAIRISNGLGLRGAQKKYFLSLASYSNSSEAEGKNDAFSDVLIQKSKLTDSEQGKKSVEYFSDWMLPVVKESIEILGNKASEQNIKESLNINIPLKTLRRVLKQLLDLGVVTYNPIHKSYVSTQSQIIPDANTLDIVAQSYHQKMCEFAQLAISEIPEEKQENNSLTISVSEEDAEKVKDLLHEVSAKIMELEAVSQGKSVVMQIGLRAFDLANAGKGK